MDDCPICAQRNMLEQLKGSPLWRRLTVPPLQCYREREPINTTQPEDREDQLERES